MAKRAAIRASQFQERSFKEPGVGSLHIEALPESALAMPSALVEGMIRVGRGQSVRCDFAVVGKTATLILQSEGVTFGPFIGWDDQRGWELGLAPEVPLELEVSFGVGSADIDLTGLLVSDLEVSMGVGRTTVTLPEEGRFNAKLEGAIGETVIVIPAGMAARISVETGLTVHDLPDSYQQRGDVYTSPGYSSADDRVDLEVSQDIGKVTVRHSGTR